MPAKKIDDSNTIKASIKLSNDDAEFLLREGKKSINRGVVFAASMIRAIEAAGFTQLIGKLTRNEWRYVALALRPEPIILEERLNPNRLVTALAEAKNEDVFADLCKIDQHELLTKVSMFNPMQTLALINRCRDFWAANPTWISGDSKEEKKMIHFCSQIAKQ